VNSATSGIRYVADSDRKTNVSLRSATKIRSFIVVRRAEATAKVENATRRKRLQQIQGGKSARASEETHTSQGEDSDDSRQHFFEELLEFTLKRLL
jgi:hypothetical protein